MFNYRVAIKVFLYKIDAIFYLFKIWFKFQENHVIPATTKWDDEGNGEIYTERSTTSGPDKSEQVTSRH